MNGKKEAYDDSSHGTHVAGCIAGDGTASGVTRLYRGIAPEVSLVIGKVLNKDGSGETARMCEGIEWVMENKKKWNIRILNISIGLEKQVTISSLTSLREQIMAAWDAGIIVVCAAGNAGPMPLSISKLAMLGNIISVGCHDGGYFGEREDLCEHYSGRGFIKASYLNREHELIRKPDLVAPGTDIISCNSRIHARGGKYINAYCKKSGTSMATAIVSGVAAKVLQYHPEWDNQIVKRYLIRTATDLNEDWNIQGWGMVHFTP